MAATRQSGGRCQQRHPTDTESVDRDERATEQCGLEVFLVNARHTKNVPGRKSDVEECQWLLKLHTFGTVEQQFSADRRDSHRKRKQSAQVKVDWKALEIVSSISGSVRGRPGDRRFLQPSNFSATSWRYQARMVSGLARRASCSSPLRPKRLPISARVARSPSDRQRGCRRAFKMRFSAASTHSAAGVPG